MTTAIELLTEMPTEKFTEIINASPRNFRESLFRAAGVKAKSRTFKVKSTSKSAVKAKKLHERVKDGFEIETDVSEELIRNYLFTRRDMLGAALTALGVEHDNGLTDEDLDTIVEELSPDKSKALKDELSESHNPFDVDLYMRFMNFPGL